MALVRHPANGVSENIYGITWSVDEERVTRVHKDAIRETGGNNSLSFA